MNSVTKPFGVMLAHKLGLILNSSLCYLSDSTAVKFSLKKIKGGDDLWGREREKEEEVLFVYIHNKNLNFAGSLKGDLAQADINTPKKLCKDHTLQAHCCCIYSVTHHYSNRILRYRLMR